MTTDSKPNTCLHCGNEVAGEGPAICERCATEGFAVCQNCGIRTSNGTTPYCNNCAEEIVGTG